jgi:hypothetical protein
MSGWRSRNQPCEPPQVLSDGCQNKHIQGAAGATQASELVALSPDLLMAPTRAAPKAVAVDYQSS